MVAADLASPGPHVVPAAVAHVQHDVSARGSERVGHRPVQVRDIWRSLARPAARVVLQVVDTPRGEQLRVLALVAATARVPGTRLDPGAGVDAQLQAPLVHGVGQEPDPPGELVGIVLEVVQEARSARPLPAVIEHHVLPSDIAHAAVSTMASAMARILPSSMSGPYTFQLFHPIGGVAAKVGRPRRRSRRPLDVSSGDSGSHEARIADTPGSARPTPTDGGTHDASRAPPSGSRWRRTASARDPAT